MTVSVVIVNWNSREFLRKCLISLSKCCSTPLEIIVVDGASYDGAGDMIAVEFPHVTFIQMTSNVGFGRCNNAAIPYLTGELTLLLNPDTEILPGSIEALVDAMVCLPNAAAAAPYLLNSDGTFQTGSIHPSPTPLKCAIDSSLFRKLYPRPEFWGIINQDKNGQPWEIEAAGGACILTRTEFFRRLGGFHPAYFMYAEDMDLCLRLRQTSGKIYHVPAARIIHHAGGSSRTVSSVSSAVRVRKALELYMSLNHGPFERCSYRISQGVVAAARLIVLIMTIPISGRFLRERHRPLLLNAHAILFWATSGNDDSELSVPII